MYLTSGVIGNVQEYQKRPVPTQRPQYTNGHSNKRRRATTSIVKASPQAHQIPPTPTSATHPPVVRTHRPSDAGTSETNGSPGDGRSVPADSNTSPYSPPLPNNLGNGPNTNGSGLNLPFSPNFTFSPLPQLASLAPSPVPRTTNLNPEQDNSGLSLDPRLSMATPYDQQATPGAGSTSGASAHTDPDSKDPFLTLLEQLAENEVSRGGPSELDFFLGGQSG